jgi:hypothetical protein
MKYLVLPALLLTIGSILIPGGVVVALFLSGPLLLLALAAVLAGLDDHTVPEHDPAIDSTEWRGGSYAVATRDHPHRDTHPRAQGHDRERRAA